MWKVEFSIRSDTGEKSGLIFKIRGFSTLLAIAIGSFFEIIDLGEREKRPAGRWVLPLFSYWPCSFNFDYCIDSKNRVSIVNNY